MINQVLSANADPDFSVKDSLPYNAEDLRGLLDFNWLVLSVSLTISELKLVLKVHYYGNESRWIFSYSYQ